ncbi:hypothetical protein E2562_018094 [Oryza meyeriana var. granulata]|uniref:Uncharacterized protein n=1 Tax=Oryza meyeriana var. granulata TaxID=110450 RepID=A0A6G1CRB4_9ORYZ|nr:hypothetical protein E2562_018094 [Oryza meyeriana var. granulata]
MASIFLPHASSTWSSGEGLPAVHHPVVAEDDRAPNLVASNPYMFSSRRREEIGATEPVGLHQRGGSPLHPSFLFQIKRSPSDHHRAHNHQIGIVVAFAGIAVFAHRVSSPTILLRVVMSGVGSSGEER